MTVITDRDVVDSVADALQFISYYHPTDFVGVWAAERLFFSLAGSHTGVDT
jgi:tartrate dehydratase alpha subunit/fumarate hydratase class I-like protein